MIIDEACKSADALLPGPYSHFRVGAAVLTTSGVCVQGANVENASYPVGTCAERVALGTAVVQVSRSITKPFKVSRLDKKIAEYFGQGARRGDIRALAVSTDISPPASPCGMCRQFIREFCEVRHFTSPSTLSFYPLINTMPCEVLILNYPSQTCP